MKKECTVLIVEDEVIYALLLKREFARAGIDVCDHVTSGEEAVLSCKKYRPDIILMDIKLAGGLDGIETAAILPKASKAKIIFMSGYTLDEIKEKAMRLSPLAFLEKPVKADTILQLLNRKI